MTLEGICIFLETVSKYVIGIIQTILYNMTWHDYHTRISKVSNKFENVHRS